MALSPLLIQLASLALALRPNQLATLVSHMLVVFQFSHRASHVPLPLVVPSNDPLVLRDRLCVIAQQFEQSIVLKRVLRKLKNCICFLW